MLESSLLKTNFVGRDGFVWWIGRVAPKEVWRDEATDDEEGWAYRCKVRIIGYHTFDDTEAGIVDEDLPWAHVLVDASKGAGQGALGSSSMMLGGETVFGFFLDGEDGQQPVIFGALARSIKPTEPYGPKNNSYSELGIFGARDATGETTRKVSDNNISSTPKNNADNKVGQSTELNPNDFEGVFSSGSNVDQHAPKGLGPHTFSNACENDAISDVTHAIGSFLTTINGLTEFAGEYIDTARNTLVDIQQLLGKVVRIVNGAIKKIIKLIRDKVMKFLGKRFQDFIAFLVPEPQQSPIGKAFERIMDIIFCIFDKLGFSLKDMLMDLFKDMVGKALNPTVCAIEQTVAAIMGSVNDSINGLLKPIMGGLDWLMGALSGIGGLLSKVSTYVDMLLGFLACDTLQCKEYEDYLQGEGGFKKPPRSWLNILNATEKMNKPVKIDPSNKAVFDTFSDGQINSVLETDTGQVSVAGGGVKVTDDLKTQLKAYVKNQDSDRKKNWRANNIFATLNELALEDDPINYGDRFSLLSILGNDVADFFDCNQKTQNPQNQDDLGRGVPPGFTWKDCIPPKVEVGGDGTKTAFLFPIVSSIDGSILTLEILEPGFGYSVPPQITIIDKTRHGGGAQAEAIIDADGKIVDIYMMSNGGGYCPSTNVVPPKYPVTEGPGIGITGGYGDDGTNLDTIAPYITFTTPSDNAVGVETAASLSLTFNEPIVKGEGEVVITESINNIVHERINVNDKSITYLSDRIIKVDPKNDLRPDTEYFISMSEGSFKDLNDNAFAGIAKTDTYNFTTRGVSGIGSQAVGIVTNLRPVKPGLGYEPGDYGMVGQCKFDFLLTPAGSIAGVQNINCLDKHNVSPEVKIVTKTGLGAKLIPIISFSPDYVADIGERPTSGMLVVNVVDCVYSLPKTQIGWVNGNPYYGDFHVHPTTGTKMVGAVHVNTYHATIYNTKEESLGQAAPVTYTEAELSAIEQSTLPQTNVSDTTTTSQSTASDTTSTQQIPQQPNTTDTTNNTDNTGSTGSSGSGGSSGGGGYGGGY
tara:strand:+ start:5115 stop:8225 length:3111 start_codon:yes stop_codon:yes gene_type:complete